VNLLFFELNESDDFPSTSKEHLNNNLFLEAEDEETGLDTDIDLGTGNHNANAGGEDGDSPSTETGETDSGTNTDASSEGTGEEGVPNLDTDPNTMMDGDGAEAGDEGTGQEGLDPNAQTGTPDVDKGKKIVLFKNYKSVYDLSNTFLEKVANFKEVSETDEVKKNNIETIEFIEEKLEKLKENLKLMLTDKYSTMDYEKLKTIFVHIKSEVNLLLNLFNKISNTKL
jgi:hypothetical protein